MGALREWRMIPKSLFIVCALAVVALLSGSASAHPHLWIDAAGTILFDKDKVTGIRFQWTFDEFFSAGVIGEFDKNNNKQFDANEIEPLRVGAFEGTKEVGFFTDIQINGEKFAIEATHDFTARIEKGVAVYQFTVPLAEPIEPAQKP
ncbi:MAG: transporter, partial [Rhodospirillales bacterium]|nr:transporter [Rhodospirillales bacterium]